MASVPSTSIALVTVLTRCPKAEYMPLLARRSTFWVSTGSDSTVWAMSNSCSSSPRMAPRIALMAWVKPGMSPWRRTCSQSRASVASALGTATGDVLDHWIDALVLVGSNAAYRSSLSAAMATCAVIGLPVR